MQNDPAVNRDGINDYLNIAPAERIARRKALFDILYARGISWEGSVLDAGIAANVVSKRGSWLSFGSEQIGQGALAATEFLRNHPDVVKEIVAKVMENKEAFLPTGKKVPVETEGE